jgi:hypothetical protein
VCAARACTSTTGSSISTSPPCARATSWPAHWRGQELDAAQLTQAGARLERYTVQAVAFDPAHPAGTSADSTA